MEYKVPRDLYGELMDFGLTAVQVSAVLEWVEQLPIWILEGIENTKVSIRGGVIVVEVAH